MHGATVKSSLNSLTSFILSLICSKLKDYLSILEILTWLSEIYTEIEFDDKQESCHKGEKMKEYMKA
jgi:hypothetical protein